MVVEYFDNFIGNLIEKKFTMHISILCMLQIFFDKNLWNKIIHDDPLK